MPRSDYNKNQNVYFLTISRWTEEATIYFLLRIFCRRRHPRYRHFWRRRRWQRRQKRQTGVAFASNSRRQRCCPANNCSFVIFFKQLKKHKFLLPDFFSKHAPSAIVNYTLAWRKKPQFCDAGNKKLSHRQGCKIGKIFNNTNLLSCTQANYIFMMLKVWNTVIIRFVVTQTLAVVQFPVQFESIVPHPDT